MFVILFVNEMLVKAVQPSNADSSMLTTLLGTLMLVICEHS